MMKFTHLFAASLVAIAFGGNPIWAGDNRSQVTADWQDGYSPSYSGYSAGYPQNGTGIVDYGQYGQWSPNSSQPYGNSGYFPPAGYPLSNPAGGIYRAPGPWRHGCHYGSCRQNNFDNLGGNSMPRSNYPNPQWGMPAYGPGNGSSFGQGVGQSFGSGASGAPGFQSSAPPFGSPSNYPAPPFPGQAYPDQNYRTPNPSYNSLPNSYNQQPNSFSQPLNLYGPSRNSFGVPPQSFGQPGSSYGPSGSSFGLQGPALNQPQTSPFYP